MTSYLTPDLLAQIVDIEEFLGGPSELLVSRADRFFGPKVAPHLVFESVGVVVNRADRQANGQLAHLDEVARRGSRSLGCEAGGH